MASPVEVSGLIYLITNLANGKQYVGQTTKGLRRRWQAHCNTAKRGFDYPLSLAIQKHGQQSFRLTELAYAASLDELNILETLYIAGLNTISPYGYNLDSGGKNFVRHPSTGRKISASRKGKKIGPLPPRSPEHCRNIGLAKKGKPSWNKGKAWSSETRAKMSEARKGKHGHPHTEEFKTNLRERNKGNAYMLGRKQTLEHVRKRIESGQRTRRLNAARS